MEAPTFPSIQMEMEESFTKYVYIFMCSAYDPDLEMYKNAVGLKWSGLYLSFLFAFCYILQCRKQRSSLWTWSTPLIQTVNMMNHDNNSSFLPRHIVAIGVHQCCISRDCVGGGRSSPSRPKAIGNSALKRVDRFFF